jgi:hypothetical protein
MTASIRRKGKNPKDAIWELPSEEFSKLGTLQDSRWLARRLGISYDKARAMGRNGEVPINRIGKLIKYSPEAIEQWLKDQMINPKGEK